MLKGYYKFVPRIQPSLLGFTNSNFGEDSQVSCVSKKDEKEEIEKKLPNEYEHYLYLKDYDHSIGKFSFNMHIFSQ